MNDLSKVRTAEELGEDLLRFSLSSVKFADLVIPLDDIDWNSGRFPTFQNFYSPHHKRSILNLVAPRGLLDDVMEMRAQLMRSFTVGSEIKAFFEYDGVRYRLSSFHDITRGDFVSCRRIASPLPPFTSIRGIRQQGIKTLLSLIARGTGGLVLFAGKSGVGKTTTMFSALQEVLKTQGGVAYTIENPPEVPLSGLIGTDYRGNCYQIDASRTSMAKELAEVRRRGNQYLLVGEIQFPDEAMEVIQAAMDGTLVLATTHGNSIIGGLERLISIMSSKGEKKMAMTNLAAGLRAVIHQEKGTFDQDGEWTFRSTMLFVEPEGSNVPGVMTGGDLMQLQDTIDQQNKRMEQNGSPFTPSAAARR